MMTHQSDNVVPLLPEKFDGSNDFNDWVSHFECVAAINYWSDAEKLLWLQAHVTGKAHMTYQRFSHEIRESYAMSKDALQKRFEPAAKVESYKAELQMRTKKESESWADFGDELLLLAEQAFPEFLEQVRDVIAFDHFLGQLQSPQISLYVRQHKPKNVKQAVDATLEVESYLLSINHKCEISASTSTNDAPI